MSKRPRTAADLIEEWEARDRPVDGPEFHRLWDCIEEHGTLIHDHRYYETIWGPFGPHIRWTIIPGRPAAEITPDDDGPDAGRGKGE